MLKFKKNKLVECTEEEFRYIEYIIQNTSCLHAAAIHTRVRFDESILELPKSKECYSNDLLFEMAYNAVMAVKYKYKYLKVTKG